MYYTGNILDKIKKVTEQISEIQEQYQTEITQDSLLIDSLKKQLDKLEETKPPFKSIDDIDIKGIETWIPLEIKKRLGISKVEINNKEQWHFSGFYDKDGYIDKYINNRPLFSDSYSIEGQTFSYTEAQLDQFKRESDLVIRNYKQRIKNMILTDDSIKTELTIEYNRRLNSYVAPDYGQLTELLAPYWS